jgi:predicted ABC-type ATPase
MIRSEVNQMEQSKFVIMAGPNGAGKTTISKDLLAGSLDIRHYVNADAIARGLSDFHSEEMAFKAGKVMLQHLHDLAAQRANFAFETTLASRIFAPWISDLKQAGYQFHLFFVWVPAADVSIARVAARVAAGGHHIPAETIRRRYERGLQNFFTLYKPLANTWMMVNNAHPLHRSTIAEFDGTINTVHDSQVWQSIVQEYSHGTT